MKRQARILVTGGTGMVGGRLAARLRAEGYSAVLSPSRRELDLADPESTRRYFREQRPEYVFLLAAKVGGIAANVADPVGFLDENLRIAVHGLAACAEFGVGRTLLLGSSCIYPRDCPQPMVEASLLGGPLEPTNEGYALAKITALKLAEAYHRQRGLRVVCPMPCNIYGTGDHFDLERSHVLSALVRRFCDAVDMGRERVELWGTGTARREFIHVDDVVEGMLFLVERLDDPRPINLGTGLDVSIRELAELIAAESGYRGAVAWDPSKPDGMPRKCLDCGRLRDLGFRAAIDLETGVRRTIAEYRALRAGHLSLPGSAAA